MSSTDSLLDLRILAENGVLDDPDGLLDSADTNDVTSVRRVRRTLAPSAGVIVLYAVSAKSQPRPSSKTRRAMDAPEDLIGLGVIYPHAAAEDDGEYIATVVRPTLSDDDADGDVISLTDAEGDFVEPGAA
jgi:hypothetical protein